MNSTILQQPPYNLNYSVNNKYEFQPSDRQYNGTLPDGDYLARKGGLLGSFDQSMSITNPNNGMNYGASQLQHETSCNTGNSQLILTPPHSGDETSSIITNPSSASFPYSNITKATGSNASGPDYYSATAPSFLPSFNGGSMTSLAQRPLHIPGPTPLSPPYTGYGAMTGGGNSFPPHYMRGMETYYPQYRLDPFRRTAPPPLGPSFATSGPYFSAQMPATPNRPEGPGFEDTIKVNTLVNSRGQNISVDILASIPKGFFRVDDKWTCYRRNYFSVSCGFTFKAHGHDSPIYLQRYNSQLEMVSGYAVSIAAKTAAATNAESESRGLVQHTPKRDKATETTPTRHVVLPSSSSGVPGNHSLSHGGLYAPSSQMSCMQNGLDAFGHIGTPTPQTNYTFERIQFQKATANNGKRRAQQQYFHVVVKLEVNIGRQGGPEEWLLVAQKQSEPMVVRGRSPGHYKDNRRDSQTSMDPEGGSGHSADGHTSYHLHSVNGAHSTNLGNTHAPYRHGQTYGTTFSHNAHHIDESENSTTSPGSSSTLASSPTKGETCHLACSMTRTSHADTAFDRVVLSPILNKTSSDAMEYARATRKRSYEDDSQDCSGNFFSHPLDHTYQHPSFDFSVTGTSQALCASS